MWAAAPIEFAVAPRIQWKLKYEGSHRWPPRGNTPKYVINEGLETEEEIFAARATEGNIQVWFYDTANRAQETRPKSQVQTIREIRHV